MLPSWTGDVKAFARNAAGPLEWPAVSLDQRPPRTASSLVTALVLVLIGAFRTQPIFAFVATTAVIISAAYLLWAIQRILFNPLDKPENAHMPDLNRRELILMAPLVAGIIWLGVYPAPVLRRMEVSAEKFVRQVESKSTVRTAARER